MDENLRNDYAPTGELRVALNFGNRVLVGRDGAGKPVGITVDLATRLAAAVDRPLHFIEFERAIDVAASALHDRWDVAFLAVDPKRAETIAFTEPYVKITGSYMVADRCNVADSDAVAGSGIRIGVVEGSAYTLHLSRQEGAQHLVALSGIFAVLSAFDAGQLDGVAGIEQVMRQEARQRAGVTVLQPPFMEIRQGMGVPAGRDAVAAHLGNFVAELAACGVVGDILEKHGVSRKCAIVSHRAG